MRIERHKKIRLQKLLRLFTSIFDLKMPITARFSFLPRGVNVGIPVYCVLCRETCNTKKRAKNCLTNFFLCKTFCISEKIQVAKTTTFERCMNLKPYKTFVHFLKFTVNKFYSHFYQVCISKRFFHSRSSHFTFASDCTLTKFTSAVSSVPDPPPPPPSSLSLSLSQFSCKISTKLGICCYFHEGCSNWNLLHVNP